MLNTKYNITYTNKKGFSMPEMLIAVFIFSLVAIATTASFVSATRTQKKSDQIQQDMENLRVAMELIGKTIRMSSNVAGDGTNLVITMYNNSENRCVSFKIDSDQKLKVAYNETETDPTNCSLSTTYPSYDEITSVGIDAGEFDVTPTTDSPKVIGRATIMLRSGGETLQTSVSFRDFENL